MTGYTTPKGVGSLVQADVRTRKTQLLLAATELFVATEAPTKVERHVYAELFRQYVDATPVSERRQIAALLARCSFAPHDCVLALAHDEDASVAHRVLAYSTVLSDCDLIAAIGRGSRAIRRAIWLRHEISDEVRTALRCNAEAGEREGAEPEDLEAVPLDAVPGDDDAMGEIVLVSAMPAVQEMPVLDLEPVAMSAEPEAEEVAQKRDALRARVAEADATLQALWEMAGKSRPSPEPEKPTEPDKPADPADVTGAADVPEPEIVRISEPDEAARHDAARRAEFGLRRTSPAARPGSLEALGEQATQIPQVDAPAADEESDTDDLVKAVADSVLPRADDEARASAATFNASPRPEPVAPASERPSQPGATLAPRAERTAPTPGFAAGEVRAARSREEVAPCPAPLARFLGETPEGRGQLIATAQARVLADAAASRVRMRAKVDADLIEQVEEAAGAGDMERLRDLLARAFTLAPVIIDWMIADPHGEPLVIAAAAMGLPTSRALALLLQVSPVAFSLNRVRALSALSAHIDIRVARHLVSEWTGIANRPARHAPVLDDAMRSRREAIVRRIEGGGQSESARQNTVDDDGILVLRNAV